MRPHRTQPTHYAIVSALSMALAASSCSGPAERNLLDDPFPTEQKELEVKIKRLLDAAQRKDFPLLESMHLYGPKFTKWDGKQVPRLDAELTRRLERAGIEPLDELQATTEDLKIDVFGEMAIATFVMSYEAAMKDQRVRTKVRATLVWVKTDSGWKIAHEHFSPFPMP